MLNLFRINDPFRLLLTLAILLIIRLPIILGDWNLLLPELHWQLIGESASADKIIYDSLWDFTGPFAVFVYQFIDFIFGRSAFVYHILSIILVFYQAIILNLSLVRRGIYNESSYIPSVLYVIFMSLNFDFLTLFPALMANTFLILAVTHLFSLNDRRNFDQEIFLIGIYLGIASMIYLPAFTFLIVGTLGLATFKVTGARHFGLVLFGFGLVISTLSVYFLFMGNLSGFFSQYIVSLFFAGTWAYLSKYNLLIIGGFSGFLLLIGVFKTLAEGRFINFQVSCQQTMLLWIIPSALSVFISPVISSFQLVFFIVPLVFFVTHWLLLVKKKLVAELIFTLIIAISIFACYNDVNNYIPEFRRADYTNLFVDKQIERQIKGKKVLVLGKNINYYASNTLATPYLNWELAKIHFQNLSDYQTIADIYENFRADYPEVIVDEAGVSKQLLKNIPLLKEKYEYDSENPKLLYLRE